MRDDVDRLLRAVMLSDASSAAEWEIRDGIDDLAAQGRTADLVRFARAREHDRIDASSAVTLLFGVAANRGPHGFGRGAGYARRDAWRSIAGLIGSDATDVAALAAAAPAASFCQIDTGADFDLRLACLRADGRSLAVLAAAAR